MNYKLPILNIIITSLVVLGCARDKKENLVEATPVKGTVTADCPPYIMDNKKNNLNISVFLDLSDRIIEPKTVQKDVAYLRSIAQSFTNHVKTKKLILLNDRIQLYFNPEPTNEGINQLAEKLHIEFDKNSPKSQIEATNSAYASEPVKLYKLAQSDSENAKDYPGSDIWRFFKDNVKDYAISDCHRNILVILTDGYMYHENTQMKEDNKTSYLTPNSLERSGLKKSNFSQVISDEDYGYIKANDHLNDLEVLVIGIESKNLSNPYAIDIIREYWSNWLTDMGVKKYKIQNADLASSVEKVINEFVQQ